MSDLIDRQAVIDLLKQMRKDGDMVPWEGKDVFARIRKLPTIQPEKAQLSCGGTTSDLISRTETVEHLRRVLEATVPITDYDEGYVDGVEFGISTVSTMPTIQPQSTTGQLNDGAQSTVQSTDLIDRQQAIDGKIVIQRTNGVEIYSDEAVPVEYLKNLPSRQPEPSTNCSEFPNNSDTISRQAAIDAVDKYDFNIPEYMEGFVTKLRDAMKEDLREDIAGLPSVQPERKKGEWVYGEDSTADCVDGYRCSQCGFFVPWDYNHKFIDYINDYAYCPNCGADMRGEKDERTD